MLDTIVPIGEIFIGVGVMTVMFVVAYWLWQIAKLYRGMIENTLKYSIAEDMMLSETMKKKGFDIDKEMLKRNYFAAERKNIYKKLKDEIFESYFSEKSKTEVKK